MRKVRWLLFPLTLAWFALVVWWMSRPRGCACGTSVGIGVATASIAAAPMHVPVADPLPATVASVSPAAPPEPAPVPSVEVPSALEAALPVLAIPFQKNRNTGPTDDALLNYVRELQLRLQHSELAGVLITGYTDADGDAALNRRLSRSRAEAIKRELITLGIPAERIRTNGAGADHPIADNLTSKGKAQNRRVEIELKDDLGSTQRTRP